MHVMKQELKPEQPWHAAATHMLYHATLYLIRIVTIDVDTYVKQFASWITDFETAQKDY